jgi:hypothetical protein
MHPLAAALLFSLIPRLEMVDTSSLLAGVRLSVEGVR